MALLSSGSNCNVSGVSHTGPTATLLLVLLPGSKRLLPLRGKLPGRLDTSGTECDSTRTVKEDGQNELERKFSFNFGGVGLGRLRNDADRAKCHGVAGAIQAL